MNNKFTVDESFYGPDVIYLGVFPKTKKAAIKVSIRKWEFIVDYLQNKEPEIVPSAGVTSCALCNLYYDNDCIGCPILEKTGYDCCSETPIELYEDTIHTTQILSALSYARNELKFLKKLYKELYE